jgi:hypothetical protein
VNFLRCELVDIQPPKGIPAAPILFRYVKKYFEDQTTFGQHIHPIYLQHDGNIELINSGLKNEYFKKFIIYLVL